MGSTLRGDGEEDGKEEQRGATSSDSAGGDSAEESRQEALQEEIFEPSTLMTREAAEMRKSIVDGTLAESSLVEPTWMRPGAASKVPMKVRAMRTDLPADADEIPAESIKAAVKAIAGEPGVDELSYEDIRDRVAERLGLPAHILKPRDIEIQGVVDAYDVPGVQIEVSLRAIVARSGGGQMTYNELRREIEDALGLERGLLKSRRKEIREMVAMQQQAAKEAEAATGESEGAVRAPSPLPPGALTPAAAPSTASSAATPDAPNTSPPDEAAAAATLDAAYERSERSALPARRPIGRWSVRYEGLLSAAMEEEGFRKGARYRECRDSAPSRDSSSGGGGGRGGRGGRRALGSAKSDYEDDGGASGAESSEVASETTIERESRLRREKERREMQQLQVEANALTERIRKRREELDKATKAREAREINKLLRQRAQEKAQVAGRAVGRAMRRTSLAKFREGSIKFSRQARSKESPKEHTSARIGREKRHGHGHGPDGHGPATRALPLPPSLPAPRHSA
jgi:hypothetical protein